MQVLQRKHDLSDVNSHLILRKVITLVQVSEHLSATHVIYKHTPTGQTPTSAVRVMLVKCYVIYFWLAFLTTSNKWVISLYPSFPSAPKVGCDWLQLSCNQQEISGIENDGLNHLILLFIFSSKYIKLIKCTNYTMRWNIKGVKNAKLSLNVATLDFSPRMRWSLVWVWKA